MCERYFYIFACILATSSFVNADLAPFLKKCHASDSKCAKEAAQAAIPIYTAGLPDLGVAPLDPLKIDKLDASTQGLKLTLTDVTVTGLKGCTVKKLQRDAAKWKLFVKVLCDINLEGTYDMDGNLLVLPIQGNGPVHVKLRQIQITAEIDFEEKTQKDGQVHWHAKGFKHSYELKEKADVVFENLFNGNEVLGRAARELIASNGNDIITEVGPPVIKKVITKLRDNINSFFRKVPVEDLVLD
ncbi:circadian clock-controlled protein daywake-like [Pectinophora gossypiella]|uniref:circadian clock-controlled protein daywake-like n=1 Tax=Pectinophora gossypiella TaxID=13191 RepID=UPI00214DFE2F|nr:circadian clock-controlled protein daywake-like [Pectinophora gossypiella]